MKLNLRVTPATIELIKRYEGLRERAARRSDGVWVIGYGHTRYAREGAQVTEKDAEALLVYDLMQISSALEKVIETPLNAHQFDALAAFTFDVGIEEFRNSEVLGWVREGALLQAASAIAAWRPPQDGRDRPSLDEIIRRRAEEKALFLRPVATPAQIPSIAPRPVIAPRSPEPVPTAQPAPVLAPAPQPVAVSPELTEPVAPAAASASFDPLAPLVVRGSPPPPPVVESQPEMASPSHVVEVPASASLPQPLRPLPPAIEPAVRRAAPPAPAPLLSVVAEPPTPSAASTDVNHYDALLQALEATAPEAPAPVSFPVSPEPVAPPVVTPQPVNSEPVAIQPIAVESVAVEPVAVEPVTVKTVAAESVATPTVVTEAVDPGAAAPQPVSMNVVGPQETRASSPPPEPVVHDVQISAASAPELIVASTAAFVLDAAPANDHASDVTNVVPATIEADVSADEVVASPVAVEPADERVETPAETVTPVLPPRPEAPPPLKRWTPPPRPPRPDRTVSTAVVIDPLPVVQPPKPAPVVPTERVLEQPAALTVEAVEAPVEPKPTSEEPAAQPPETLVEARDLPADHVETPVPPADAPAPALVETTKDIDAVEARPNRRAFFQKAPERAPPSPPPEKPREPVTLRLGALPYLLLGLLGVMLFTGALVSMFRQANVTNLLAGLAGVAFMAPSAGHFLLTLVGGQRTPPSQPV